MSSLVGQSPTKNDPWASPPDNFHFVLFERVNIEEYARPCGTRPRDENVGGQAEACPPTTSKLKVALQVPFSQENAARYYWLGRQPTLFGWGVVRLWGRKGETQHRRIELFSSLEEAWPALRKHIRARLRHGYQLVRMA